MSLQGLPYPLSFSCPEDHPSAHENPQPLYLFPDLDPAEEGGQQFLGDDVDWDYFGGEGDYQPFFRLPDPDDDGGKDEGGQGDLGDDIKWDYFDEGGEGEGCGCRPRCFWSGCEEGEEIREVGGNMGGGGGGGGEEGGERFGDR
jgi:hypothetical protein